MEHKIARICWNTRYWQRPSGSEGKSKNKDAYEQINGFGHEEWLFDTSKVVDGYHYGYIQAIRANREKYLNESFDLSLYSIDDRTKQRWWLGTVRNVSVVGPKESVSVYELYKKRGWLEQMRSQLREVGANVDAFDKDVTPEMFSVIKYRIDDSELLNEPLEFVYGDPAVKSDYYNLKNYVQEPKLLALSKGFEFKSGHNPPSKKKKLSYDQHERDVNDYHVEVQRELYRRLCEKHGANNVGTEINTGAGSRVDVVLREGNKYSLYEIKICASLQLCVREAVGQLLEYRHTIGPAKILKLIVVSPHAPDHKISSYLEYLRTKHAIPIHYEQCGTQAAQQWL